jgi:hypothetical protein
MCEEPVLSGRERLQQLVAAGIRSIAASLPVAASFAQAWNEYRGVQFEARVRGWFEHLAAELSELGCQVHSLPADAPVILERTIEKVARETFQGKLRSYARFYARYLAEPTPPPIDLCIDIIESLDALTEQDLLALSMFRRAGPIRVEDVLTALRRNMGGGDDAVLGILVPSLCKLESRGLIGKTTAQGGTGVFAYAGPPDLWQNRWRREYYELLPFGQKFIAFVAQAASP